MGMDVPGFVGGSHADIGYLKLNELLPAGGRIDVKLVNPVPIEKKLIPLVLLTSRQSVSIFPATYLARSGSPGIKTIGAISPAFALTCILITGGFRAMKISIFTYRQIPCLRYSTCDDYFSYA
jgi:hypothetical protein